MKTLLVDIETAPSLGYVWGKYQQDVLSFEKDWYILSFAYKWLGEKKTKAHSLPEYKTYKQDQEDDKLLCQELWKVMDEADVVIAHNGDRFDVRKSNARFVQHGFNPPSTFKTVDTLKVARKYFKFDSNRLNDLGSYLDVGQKVDVGSFNTWKKCMVGDKKAWKKMVTYNKKDVDLLEAVYLKLRPWMTNHPNANLYLDTMDSCPNCGKHTLQRRGYSYTRTGKFQRYQCTSCGAWSKGENINTLREVVVR